MNVLSLFSGIGGLDLGLERAGMTIVGQVEIDPFCQSVLAKHWPEVPCHDDVRTCVPWWQSEARPTVDLVCGGFPCQPISTAGKRRGQADDRWLWPEFAAVLSGIRPRYAILENVSGIRSNGLGGILGDLAALRYDVVWDCVPASAVGAPHQRDRWFAVAYTDREGQLQPEGIFGEVGRWVSHSSWWTTEPALGRVAYGVSGGVDRLKALGNAVVPQVAEHIGRIVLDAEAGRRCTP